jgi:hypothetical protein
MKGNNADCKFLNAELGELREKAGKEKIPPTSLYEREE